MTTINKLFLGKPNWRILRTIRLQHFKYDSTMMIMFHAEKDLKLSVKNYDVYKNTHPMVFHMEDSSWDTYAFDEFVQNEEITIPAGKTLYIKSGNKDVTAEELAQKYAWNVSDDNYVCESNGKHLTLNNVNPYVEGKLNIEYKVKGGSQIAYARYDAEDLGTGNKLCIEYLDPIDGAYKLAEPFKTDIGSKHYITKVVDCTGKLSAITNSSFRAFNNLEELNVPNVKDIEVHGIWANDKLSELNVSSLYSNNGTMITQNPLVSQMYVDSENLKSIDNGYGALNKLVVTKQSIGIGDLVVVAAAGKFGGKVKNDEIVKMYNSDLLEDTDLSSIEFKNYKDTSYTNYLYSGYDNSGPQEKIDLLYVDNDIIKSGTNGVDDKRTVLYSADGKTLYGGYFRNHTLSNNEITAISNSALNTKGIVTLSIDNDVYESRLNGHILVDKKQHAVKFCDVTDPKYMQALMAMNDISVALALAVGCSYGYAAMRKTLLDKFEMPSLTKLQSQSFSYSPILSIILDNVDNLVEAPFNGNLRTQYISMQNAKNIPNSAFYIGSKATSYVDLSAVNIPNAESIGNLAFNYRRRLSTIDVPKCKSVGVQAFRGCSGMKTADLRSCTSFGSQAFLGSGLEQLSCQAVSTSFWTEMQQETGTIMTPRYECVKLPVGCKCYCSNGTFTVPSY